MNKDNSSQKLNELIALARRAPEAEPPSIRPGFAMRVARSCIASGHSAAPLDAALPGFRWAILAFAVFTILVAAVNAPSVVIDKFTYGAAFESHVLKHVLLHDE
ncbi:MAG: hypothetical protein KDN22_25075 [Verrucomicrobiae bacterium]|nr:hypothetical protein [Verrucomicrobiae bacterium]